ncbi:hypothetical protein ADZ36_29225, partial [Streptomyces fradiae]
MPGGGPDTASGTPGHGAAAPAGRPGGGAHHPDDRSALPPIQRTTAHGGPVASTDFGRALRTWQNPSFSGPGLSHAVLDDAPTGIIHGLLSSRGPDGPAPAALAAPAAPTGPVARAAAAAPGPPGGAAAPRTDGTVAPAPERAVQRAVAAARPTGRPPWP